MKRDNNKFIVDHFDIIENAENILEKTKNENFLVVFFFFSLRNYVLQKKNYKISVLYTFKNTKLSSQVALNHWKMIDIHDDSFQCY